MELFIRIKNGQPFEHPILGENFRQVFPHIDTNNLPPEFARFERVEPPTLGVYEIMSPEEPVYELVDGVYKDVWYKRDMTFAEKAVKKRRVIEIFYSREQAANWSAWVFDEDACIMRPPIPRPAPIEGVLVMWCGADNNWREAPARPEGQYKFDFFAWEWVAIP